MEMVVEGGFDTLSVNKLAAACDYTPGALYRYFRSKDALMIALVARAIRQFHKDVGAKFARRVDELEKALDTGK